MLRICSLLVGLGLGVIPLTGGCRSCDSGHDYAPPVAGCDCHASGTQRAGSVSGGYATEAYPVEGYYESDPQLIDPPVEEEMIEPEAELGTGA